MISVSIDGPAGAGKSSVARDLARKLDFVHIDTGAIYRAFALLILEKGINPKDDERVKNIIPTAKISIDYKNSEQITFLNKVDVSSRIRHSDVTEITAVIARNPDVRTALVLLLQSMTKDNNIIMDGRDIGTVVLPNADVKIYLTARAEERAKRRVAQQEKQGIHEDFEDVLNKIRDRDYNDINKSGALKKADDAIVIDNSDWTKEETISKIAQLILEAKEKT